MINPDLDHLPAYPFQRLAGLLDPLTPGGPVVSLSLGEPQYPLPDVARQAMDAAHADWRRYPPTNGSPALRTAIKAWLDRRYTLPAAMIDADRMIQPVSGTREALFMTGDLLIPKQKNGQTPLVAMPDPFYQPYLGTAVLNGAEIIGMATPRSNRHLPDPDSLTAEDRARLAILFICSPANPQGTTLSKQDWGTWISLARACGAILIADECYSELYDPQGEPPSGCLDACAELGGSLDHVLVFNSLSKRSNAAGLRSGFVCGDPHLIDAFRRLRAYGQAGMPLPIAAASTALWQDETHVAENRRLYADKRALATEIFGDRPGYDQPEAGFFLWLDVGSWGYDGEAAARILWTQAGLRTLPGAYMSLEPDGPDNPARGYLRVALVHDVSIVKPALHQIATCLPAQTASSVQTKALGL